MVDNPRPSNARGLTLPLQLVPDLTENLLNRKFISKGDRSDIYEADLSMPMSQGDSNSKTHVIVKVLRLPAVSEPRRVERERLFIRATHAWYSLKHSNISALLGTAFEPNCHGTLSVIVTQYYEHRDMWTYVKNCDPSTETILIFAEGVANGLHYLHSQDPPFIHGDIKARNVLIDSDLNPRISNVGLACLPRSVDKSGHLEYAFEESLRWMSPELFDAIDSRRPPPFSLMSDVWAYGCLVLEIASKLQPYHDQIDKKSVMKALWGKKPPSKPPVDLLKTELSAILKLCWKAKPTKRPPMTTLSSRIRNLREALKSRTSRVVVMRRLQIQESAAALQASGNAAWENGNWNRAITDFRAAVNEYVLLDAKTQTAYCKYRLGMAYLDSGDRDIAQNHLDAANASFKSLGESQLQAETEQLLARLERLRRHLSEAKAMISQVLKDSRKAGWTDIEGWCLFELGNIESDANDHEAAANTFEDMLSISRKLENRRMQGRALDALSRLTSVFPLSQCIDRCRWALDCFREVKWSYMEKETQVWLLTLERPSSQPILFE